jgi:hypothetical protein
MRKNAQLKISGKVFQIQIFLLWNLKETLKPTRKITLKLIAILFRYSTEIRWGCFKSEFAHISTRDIYVREIFFGPLLHCIDIQRFSYTVPLIMIDGTPIWLG